MNLAVAVQYLLDRSLSITKISIGACNLTSGNGSNSEEMGIRFLGTLKYLKPFPQEEFGRRFYRDRAPVHTDFFLL